MSLGSALTGCDLWGGPQITPFVTTVPESTWAPTAVETAVTAVPTLTSTEVPTAFLATPEVCQYEVQAGDSLWFIAQEFGTTVAEIARESGLPNPDLIYQGQVLIIPGGYREGCLTEVIALDPSAEDDSNRVPDFSRAPLANPTQSGWGHGVDENAVDYDNSGCYGSRPQSQPCLHPGYDIYSTDYTVGANSEGVVRYYQSYTHRNADGSTETRTVEYDPEDPVANEDLVWFGNYAVLETTVGGQTYYQVFAHMESFPEDLNSGDRVEAGTGLGIMNCTGNCSGDHVHWEVRTAEGNSVNGRGNYQDFYPSSEEQLQEHFVDPLALEEQLPPVEGG